MDTEQESELEIPGERATTMFNTTVVDFEQPSTLIGQRLEGRFLIEKDLSESGADEGGFGLVYLAKDVKLMDKAVVVKILKESALQQKDIIRKFLHEKEALIRLNHPGIVNILDFGTLIDGNPFMVMEYIEGHSLRKELRRHGKLKLHAAAELIEAVTDALAAAHSKNILHRDIKPENIMLQRQAGDPDRVRLIDFGIARVGDSQLAPATEVSRPIGTVLYMSPEQLVGNPNLTPASDIFAVAIVAYEALTGKLPFEPRTIAEMYQLEKAGVKVRPTELIPEIPSSAERLLLSALEFEPEQRPQNVRAFGQNLAAALKGELDLTLTRNDVASEMKTADFDSEKAVTARFLPDSTEVVERSAKTGGSIKLGIAGLAAMLLVFLGVGYVAWSNLKSNAKPADPKSNLAIEASVSEHFLSYYLTAQKIRNGKPSGQPFQSSGRETFLSGDSFRMTFQPDADGYMYLFNEGRDEKDNTGYYLLFPTPTANNGFSKVTGGQQIETGQNTFTGGKGVEVMWLIWTKEKLDSLESVVKSAVFAGGDVRFISSADSLDKFLKSGGNPISETITDEESKRALVKAKGDIIIHRFELNHQ